MPSVRQDKNEVLAVQVLYGRAKEGSVLWTWDESKVQARMEGGPQDSRTLYRLRIYVQEICPLQGMSGA